MPDNTPDFTTTMKNLAVSSIRPLFFTIVAVAVLWFIGTQIVGPNSILTKLNDTPTSRGLITFVVATATVAGALILVLAAIISEGSADDVKLRLSEGRQVMAPLVGILGTVVGFYFGQATPASGAQGGGTAAPSQQELRVTDMAVAPPQVAAAGGPITVSGTVTGGTKPYTYSITFPGLAQPVTGKVADERIAQSVTIPSGLKPPQVTIQLEVTDSAKATVKTERPLKIGAS